MFDLRNPPRDFINRVVRAITEEDDGLLDEAIRKTLTMAADEMDRRLRIH